MATERSQKAKALADKAKEFVTLAHPYNPKKHNVEGWVASEKLDGVRARWVNGQLLSRYGKPFAGVPAEVLDELKYELGSYEADGELWCGRGRFQKLVSLVKNSRTTIEDWRREGLQYQVFDVVTGSEWSTGADWKGRLDPLGARLILVEATFCVEHPHSRVQDHLHVMRMAQEVYALGGEGLILRNPNAPYTFGRSHDLLKVKCSEEAEFRVWAHVPGEGKHIGRLGALECYFVDGDFLGEDGKPLKGFKVGTGFTDEQRESPPPVGSVVTVRYMGLTEAGLPREPRFVAIRDYE